MYFGVLWVHLGLGPFKPAFLASWRVLSRGCGHVDGCIASNGVGKKLEKGVVLPKNSKRNGRGVPVSSKDIKLTSKICLGWYWRRKFCCAGRRRCLINQNGMFVLKKRLNGGKKVNDETGISVEVQLVFQDARSIDV